jgi:hypothetical protein
MEIKLHLIEEIKIAELLSNGLIINDLDDALDLIGNAFTMGASKVIVQKDQLHPDFFNLSNKMAGDILQKFSTYRMQLAIVGDFSNVSGKSLRDFIYESNKVGRIFFVASMAEAFLKLSK